MPRASALRRRRSVHLQREYRRLRRTTLKKLLATPRCGAAMAAGVATIPSIRPNGARSGLSDQLAQAVHEARARGGKPRSLWRRNSLRKRLRFARNGGHHRNARRIGGSCLSDRGSFAGLYRFLVIILLIFCVNYIGPSPHMIKTACAKFRTQKHPNNRTFTYSDDFL